MRKVTLCFLLRGNEVCLAMKKRGFGAGKWNGVGGKVQDGETLEQAAVREMEEEIGVKAEAKNLEPVGEIEFFFLEKSDWNQCVHIYILKEWHGEPKESEEMMPKWFKLDEIPYEEMWVADRHWIPMVLDSKKIKGSIYFKGNGAEFEKVEIEEV